MASLLQTVPLNPVNAFSLLFVFLSDGKLILDGHHYFALLLKRNGLIYSRAYYTFFEYGGRVSMAFSPLEKVHKCESTGRKWGKWNIGALKCNFQIITIDYFILPFSTVCRKSPFWMKWSQ